MSEDRGFEVVDKRRVSAEATGETAPASPPPSAADETEKDEASAEPQAEAGAAAQEEQPGFGPEGLLPEMDAVSVVSVCINMLHEVAWMKMGLVPSPITQKFERDLTQARLAIDCVADLGRHLESRVDANHRRDLQNLISTLRMNYVQQSQRE
jgi:hypothetical protein